MRDKQMNIHKWEFAESLGDRKEGLLSAPSYEAIIESIQKKMMILCCHEQPCDDDKRFSRVVYCIKVCKPLFDLFFNSKHGYRASYYRSPYDGLHNNELFIHSLLPALLASDCIKDVAKRSGFAEKKVEESLKSYSAKAWLAEIGKEIDSKCTGCAGEWNYPQDDTAEILNDRWDKAPGANAKCGRKAPYLTKIRIFGAFLNEQYDEFIPAAKRYRANHIYKFGWS
jgi:hypothetical protein